MANISYHGSKLGRRKYEICFPENVRDDKKKRTVKSGSSRKKDTQTSGKLMGYSAIRYN